MTTDAVSAELGNRLIDISNVTNRLLEVIRNDLRESKEIQIELRLTIKAVSQTVADLKKIIYGNGDRESMPMLLQRLNLELDTLTERVCKLEASHDESAKQATKVASVTGERLWSLASSMAPSLLFGLLVLIYMIMNVTMPDLTQRVRQSGYNSQPPNPQLPGNQPPKP